MDPVDIAAAYEAAVVGTKKPEMFVANGSVLTEIRRSQGYTGPAYDPAKSYVVTPNGITEVDEP